MKNKNYTCETSNIYIYIYYINLVHIKTIFSLILISNWVCAYNIYILIWAGSLMKLGLSYLSHAQHITKFSPETSYISYIDHATRIISNKIEKHCFMLHLSVCQSYLIHPSTIYPLIFYFILLFYATQIVQVICLGPIT